MRMVAVVGAIVVTLSGCGAPTRMMHMGPLTDRDWLVTLVVSEDQRVVASECVSVAAVGPVLGCHLWHRLDVDDAGDVRVVKIVRYTDVLPSTLALEIDVHELCHAIAALQPMDDPCHRDNDGVIQSADAALAARWRTAPGASSREDTGRAR